jgi:hypothetical protein
MEFHLTLVEFLTEKRSSTILLLIALNYKKALGRVGSHLVHADSPKLGYYCVNLFLSLFKKIEIASDLFDGVLGGLNYVSLLFYFDFFEKSGIFAKSLSSKWLLFSAK